MKTALSPREIRVAELAAIGMLDKQIARELSISQSTLREYVKRAMRKLNVESREALLLAAWQAGDIDLRALATRVTGRAWTEGVSA